MRRVKSRNSGAREREGGKKLSATIFFGGLCFLVLGATPVQAQLDFGADAVSRYVWRGLDFGNSAAVQPWIAYTVGNMEVGAWSSWGLTSPVANENDLYVSYSTESFGVILTDYYFPVSSGPSGTWGFFEFDQDATPHIIELLGSATFGDFAAALGMNVYGDDDNSIYAECSYDWYAGEYVNSSVVFGLGNGVYNPIDGEFYPVQVGLSASKDSYFASYIINPKIAVSWLVFGLTI